jgi:hypothetical protein
MLLQKHFLKQERLKLTYVMEALPSPTLLLAMERDLENSKPNWVLGMPLFLPSFLLLLFVSNHNSWVLASTIA